MASPYGRIFQLRLYVGEWVTAQVANQWPPFVPLDPTQFMFYRRILTLEDMVEMKVGIYVGDCINSHGNCTNHLQRLMTHMVVNAEAHVLSVNVLIAGQVEQATFTEVPLIPEPECPELPFLVTFTRVAKKDLSTMLGHEDLMPVIPEGILAVGLNTFLNLLTLEHHVSRISNDDPFSQVVHDHPPRHFWPLGAILKSLRL
ncbi:hypothetical protein Cgig2_006671 [Carnegiea gigantea]|uniref:Uncharacterized protein n=1 Tax=Carnegiea gigantea TaxID=171969 RepID=A0A9Q1GGX3_9CARY|nr:hypothetical protein Cgig2_006671 [Carnegiea gigantea]